MADIIYLDDYRQKTSQQFQQARQQTPQMTRRKLRELRNANRFSKRISAFFTRQKEAITDRFKSFEHDGRKSVQFLNASKEQAKHAYQAIRTHLANVWSTEIPETDTPKPETEKKAQETDADQPKKVSRFSKFLQKLRTDPKSVAIRSEQVLKQTAEKAKNLPAFVDKVKQRMLDTAIDVQSKNVERLKAKRKEIDKSKVELGHPNVQGLELVRDKDNPQGYRFKATKKISIPTGEVNEDGTKKYMHMEAGDTTGLIIPKGKANTQALAAYSHGDKYVKLALSHDSTLTMEDGLNNPDIFGKSAGSISNSDITLSGKGSLDGINQINNSRNVVIDNSFKDTQISNSRNISLYAPVEASNINNSYHVLTHGAISNSAINASTVDNSGNGPIADAKVNYSTVSLGNQEGIAFSDIDSANLKHTSVIGFKDGNKTEIHQGNYANSTISASKISVSPSSSIEGSTVANTQIKHASENHSLTALHDSALDHVTMALEDGNIQATDNVNMKNVMAVGDIAASNSEISADQSHPAFMRDFGMQNTILDTKEKSPILFDGNLDGKGQELGDDNIYRDMTVDDNHVNWLKDKTGIETPQNELREIDTPNGVLHGPDQVAYMSQDIQPQNVPINYDVNKMFNMDPVNNPEPPAPTQKEEQAQAVGAEEQQSDFKQSDPTQRDWVAYNDLKMANKRDLAEKTAEQKKKRMEHEKQAENIPTPDPQPASEPANDVPLPSDEDVPPLPNDNDIPPEPDNNGIPLPSEDDIPPEPDDDGFGM